MSAKFFFPQRPSSNPKFQAYYESKNPPGSVKTWYRGPLARRKDCVAKPWDQSFLGELVALGFMEKVEEPTRRDGKEESP